MNYYEPYRKLKSATRPRTINLHVCSAISEFSKKDRKKYDKEKMKSDENWLFKFIYLFSTRR